MSVRRVAIAALAVAALAPRIARGALDPRKLVEQAKPSVALVSLFDARDRPAGSGSGFVVGDGTRLLTNHHVIEGADHATATFPDGREVVVRGLLADDPGHDVALVALDGAPLPALPLGDSSAVRVGDEIAIIGSPLGLSTALSTGIVSAVRAEGLSKHKAANGRASAEAWGLQVTAAISPGSSGSPILDADGRVVGVAVGMLVGGENLNFGVPVDYAKALVARGEHAPLKPLAGEATSAWKNLGISAALFFVPYVGWLGWSRWTRRKRRPARSAH